jgi:hypothetical protein
VSFRASRSAPGGHGDQEPLDVGEVDDKLLTEVKEQIYEPPITDEKEGPMRLVSVIQDERVARRILEHLGLAPPRGRPWHRGQQLALDDSDRFDEPTVS